MDDFDIIIGSNLKRLRMNRGWTVDFVASGMDMTTDAVYKYERGERHISAHFALRASEFLGCSILDVYRGTTESLPESARELNVLSRNSSAIMLWLATQWDGDIEPLIVFLGMVATMPKEVRRELYMQATIMRDGLLKSGIISADDLPQGIDLMEQSIGGLYEDTDR